MRTVSASVFKLHRMFGCHKMMTPGNYWKLKFKSQGHLDFKGRDGTNVISSTVLNKFSLS